MIIQKERNTYLDITKGFAIILVIMGHCIQYGSGENYFSNNEFFYNPVFKFIYSFHMPLFMLISGYLFSFSIKKHSAGEIIKSRIKTLLIPILSFSFIIFIIDLCTKPGTITFIQLIKNYINIAISNLWYLWALFYCSLIVLFVHKFFKDSLIIYLLGFFASFFVPDSYLLHLYKFVYPFFMIGYLYHQRNQPKAINENSSKTAVLFSGIIFFILLSFYRYEHYIYTSRHCILRDNISQQFFIDIYRTLIGLAGSLFILGLISLCCSKFKNNFITGLLVYLGQQSFGIYAISGLLFSYILPQITRSFAGINYFYTLIESAAIIVICLMTIFILQKSNILKTLFLGSR